MKRKALLLSAFCLMAGWVSAADITVYPSEQVGPVKEMNGVNNGPKLNKGDQIRFNFDAYKACHFPYARTHDAAFSETYGGSHTVDILNIFPDFSKDANKPENYDFAVTDAYLRSILDAGTQVFFRLGQKIENSQKKKYYIYPPKDFKKWAQICEHIIRHYNEGWAEGHQWNIKYWEIWNEADLDDGTRWQTDPRTWAGTKQQFFDFYATAAKYLKGRFPNLMIGGPALAGNMKWAEDFLAYMQKEGVKLDFFSWHIYSTKPENMVAKSRQVDALLKKYGYEGSESILNEWNYVKGWSDNFPYSVDVIRGPKGAAFCSAVMSACQNEKVNKLMYYDARIETCFNGLFDLITLQPTQVYYGFYAWSKLVEYGTQVKTESNDGEFYVTAARNADGRLRVMVTRYNEDNNSTKTKYVKIKTGTSVSGTRYMHLTDEWHAYTEIPVELKNGEATLMLYPNSIVLLEI